MPYVERDENNKIVGVSARQNPGVADEFVSDDDPDLVAYLNPEPTYRELREAAYAPIQEQLDMQYWDRVNGTTTWADHIQAVKSAYPKP